ncbi:MAG: chemotaxis protein CheW [Syntrophobacteraceae bacterium]|jgi:purine-binding chemotaxis protein CheW
MRYATFFVGEDLLGIPIHLVQEIARFSSAFPIPGHDPRIDGLVNLRGRMAVVINLRRCLMPEEAEAVPPAARPKLIVLETNDGIPEEAREMGVAGHDEPVVLVVDDVHKIVDDDLQDYYPPPAHVRGEYIEGMIKVDDRLITLISVPRLINALTEDNQEAPSNAN